MILLCVNSLLPTVPSPECLGGPRGAVASVEASCNRLLAVALLVSAPLQTLHDALGQGRGEGGGGGGMPWRVFVKANRHHAVVADIPEDTKMLYLLCPLAPPQHPLLLQVCPSKHVTPNV